MANPYVEAARKYWDRPSRRKRQWEWGPRTEELSDITPQEDEEQINRDRQIALEREQKEAEREAERKAAEDRAKAQAEAQGPAYGSVFERVGDVFEANSPQDIAKRKAEGREERVDTSFLDKAKEVGYGAVEPLVSELKGKAKHFTSNQKGRGEQIIQQQEQAKQQASKLDDATRERIESIKLRPSARMKLNQEISSGKLDNASVNKRLDELEEQERQENLKVAGAATEAASMVLGGGSIPAAFKAGGKQIVKTGAGIVTSGAVGGVGGELARNPDATKEEIAKSAALGGGLALAGDVAVTGAGAAVREFPRKVYRGAPEGEAVSFVTGNKKLAKAYAEGNEGVLQKYRVKPKDVFDLEKPEHQAIAKDILGEERYTEISGKTPSGVFYPIDEDIAAEVAEKAGFKAVKFDERDMVAGIPDELKADPFTIKIVDSSAVKSPAFREVKQNIDEDSSTPSLSQGPESTASEPLAITASTMKSDVANLDTSLRSGSDSLDSSIAPQVDETPKITTTPTVGTPTLAKGVRSKAIKKKLIYGFDKTFKDMPEYDKVNVKAQGQKASEIVLNSPDEAFEIAMGRKRPPDGVLPESVFVALENYALDSKNVDVLRELALNSNLTSEATGMGQRIRMLAERDPDSAVGAIQNVSKARQKAAEKRLKKPINKAVKDTTEEIKKMIKVKKVTKTDWAMFAESIKC